MRLYARGMNASFDRIDSRGKDVETTLRESRRFVFKARTERFLSPKIFGSLLRERRDVFRVDFSTDQTLSSFFLRNAEHTHRLVSMPPVKPPSYTNLSSEKS